MRLINFLNLTFSIFVVFIFVSCGIDDTNTQNESSQRQPLSDKDINKIEIYTEKVQASLHEKVVPNNVSSQKYNTLNEKQDPSFPINSNNNVNNNLGNNPVSNTTPTSEVNKPIPAPNDNPDIPVINPMPAPIPTPNHNPNPFPMPNPTPSYDDYPSVDIDKIINIGKQIWTIIDANKPVVNTQIDYANAVPQGIQNLMELENFSDLQYNTYRTSLKFLGVTVCDITYTLVHQYNGSYKGKGKYLANISIIPSKINVKWGFKLNFEVVSVSTMNVGTSENPIGSALLKVRILFSPVLPLYYTEQNILFQFRGDSPVVTKRTDM